MKSPMQKGTKLFPDIKTMMADAMSDTVYEGLVLSFGQAFGSEIKAHQQAGFKNDLPPEAVHFAAIDGTVRLLADLLVHLVSDPKHHGRAIDEVANELERHMNQYQKRKEGKPV